MLSQHHLSVCMAFLACLLLIRGQAHGSEAYYLAGKRVLLYKVINWCYDCPGGEADRLCGARATCRSTGGTRVSYDESQQAVSLHLAGGFADLLSIAKPDEPGGLPYLTCAWLSETYFGRGRADEVPWTETSRERILTIRQVDKHHGRGLRGIENDIVVELHGRVGGLLSGRLSLYRPGDSIRSCPEDAREPEFSIVLTIARSTTKEVLARYKMRLRR